MEEQESVLEREDKRRYWECLIKGWEQSGLRQTEYCRLNGLKIRNFGYWKRRLSQKSTDVSFVSLQVQANNYQPTASSAASLKVVLGRGQRIEVTEGFDQTTLKRLIYALEEL